MRLSLRPVFLYPVILCLFFASHVSATILHVPLEYGSIQDAINRSTDGDVIIVSEGTYFENISLKGKAVTLMSESGPHACIINGGKDGPVVTFDKGEGHRCILRGFTITNGSGKSIIDGNLHYHYGAGIYIEDASPTIVDNIIHRNALPTVTGNTVLIAGGGIFAGHPTAGSWISGPTIRGNLIYNNFSGGHGGGIAIAAPNLNETINITNNMIYNNTADSNGGAIYIAQYGKARLLNNQIFGNKAWNGGGVYGWSFGMSGSKSIFRNNIVYGNTADNWGGAVSLHFTRLLSVNNTYADNHSLKNGGGFYLESCRGKIMNDIFWGNTCAHLGPQGYLYSSSFIRMLYTNIEKGVDGFYNTSTCALHEGPSVIKSNPVFELESDNYHLSILSPCRNAGKNSAPGMVLTDFEGQRRIYENVVDIGADEFQPN